MNNRFFIPLFLYFFISLFCTQPSTAQENSNEKLIQYFDSYRKQNLQEKLYVQTDRERYLCGELIWYKIYSVNGVNHHPLDISRVAYFEILDENNNPVIQEKIPLHNGMGEGSIFIPSSLNSGTYVLRAYTNWMKNFDPAFYFHKEINVINNFRRLPLSQQKDSVGLSISFFPEGGNLVTGLENNVAFKFSNQAGKDLEAQLVNDLGDTITSVIPYKYGIGTFIFTPEKGMKYMVVANCEGKVRSFPLPKVFDQGYTMRVQEQLETLQVNVGTNHTVGEMIHLLVHSRQHITFYESKILSNGKLTFSIDKDLLDDGISHLTLFNQDLKPLCERLFFSKIDNKMNLKVLSERESYSSRQLVKVSVDTKDGKNNLPLEANLAMSVFKIDSINKFDFDILTYLYLDSELKGYIDHQKYPLKNVEEYDAKLIDQLMLTHGWSRFKWEDILNENSIEKIYVPEIRGHIINARIFSSETNEPVKNVVSYLSLPGLVPQMTGSVSDKNGNLVFVLNDFYSDSDLVLKTDFTRDSLYKFSILNPFSEKYTEYRSLSDFQVTERWQKSLKQRSISLQTRNIYFGDSIKTIIYPEIDSTSFYYQPNDRYYLDDYTRFASMEDVMREYVPGIWVRKNKNGYYFRAVDLEREEMFNNNPMVLYDGIPIFDIDKVMQIDPLKVKRLDIVKHRYHYGELSFDGIVNYSSYTGNIPTYQIDPRAIIAEYDGYQEQREFYIPDHTSNSSSRKPDFRNLLYWNGNIQTDEDGNYQTDFFTSDEKGQYLILIQGISNTGLAGEGLYSFEVINLNN